MKLILSLSRLSKAAQESSDLPTSADPIDAVPQSSKISSSLNKQKKSGDDWILDCEVCGMKGLNKVRFFFQD